MNKTLKVAIQEFKMMAANKAFVVITILGPILILAVSVLPTLLATSQSSIKENTIIAVVNAPREMIPDLNKGPGDSNISFRSETDPEKAKQQVRDESIQALVILPEDSRATGSMIYYSRTGTDMLVYETVRGVLGNYITTRRFIDAGIDPQLVSRLSQRPALEIKKLAGDGEEEEAQDFMSIMMTVIAFVMLIYMTVLLYGQTIGRSVVTEKTEKTVEIMLSSVTPRQMMFGKILGIGLAGIVQYAFWISLAMLLIHFIGPVFSLTIPGSLTLFNLLFMLAFFIIAYFLYSSAYAAIGAAAEDEQHMGQLGMPLIFFLVIPMVSFSAIVMNPASLFSLVLSYFPLTAPLVMLVRVIVAMPPVWEIVLSMGITVAAIFLVILVAAKIFRVGILMTGKRFKLLEILKWIRIK